MAKNKDINPYKGIMDALTAWLTNRPDGISAPKQSYGGPLSAGWSPQTEMARQLMAQRAASGGPAAWNNVQNFTNMYGGGMTQGVFNPFTSQIQRPQMPGGQGGPPMGGGGGGGMNPQMMQMIMQMMQQRGQGGGSMANIPTHDLYQYDKDGNVTGDGGYGAGIEIMRRQAQQLGGGQPAPQAPPGPQR